MKAVIAAFAANLGIMVTKFAAFLLTGSASMLAEAIHSVADTGNEALLLIGRGRSERPRSAEHPFGFGRERYFYAFVVSVMLFTVGATFSAYDGLHKILYPEPVHSVWVDFLVLGASAVLEAFSLRTGISEANKIRGNRGWGTFIRRTKVPELPVVLLEDTAALIGLVFAFAGIALSALTGDGRWDGAGSLGIGALLAAAAAILAVETKSLLIGESASIETQAKIVAALETSTPPSTPPSAPASTAPSAPASTPAGAPASAAPSPGPIRVIHLRTVHIGPDTVLVAAKIEVPPTYTAAQVAAAIDAAEIRVRAAVPIATTIYLEPDIYRPGIADRTDPSIRAVLASHPRPTPADPPPPPPPTQA